MKKISIIFSCCANGISSQTCPGRLTFRQFQVGEPLPGAAKRRVGALLLTGLSDLAVEFNGKGWKNFSNRPGTWFSYLNRVYSSLSRKFSSLNRGYSSLSKQFSYLNKRFSCLSERFSNMNRQFSYLSKQFSYLSKRFSCLSKGYSKSKNTFCSLNGEFSSECGIF